MGLQHSSKMPAKSKVRRLHVETAKYKVMPDYIVLLAEKLIDNVFDVEHVSNRIILVRLILDGQFSHSLLHTPHNGFYWNPKMIAS